eukprot:scaffold401_cov399-Prasinococcus_capsulatus_cf.AAC.26
MAAREVPPAKALAVVAPVAGSTTCVTMWRNRTWQRGVGMVAVFPRAECDVAGAELAARLWRAARGPRCRALRLGHGLAGGPARRSRVALARRSLVHAQHGAPCDHWAQASGAAGFKR